MTDTAKHDESAGSNPDGEPTWPTFQAGGGMVWTAAVRKPMLWSLCRYLLSFQAFK